MDRSFPGRKAKGRGDSSATVLWACIFQCYPNHFSLLLPSVFKLPTVPEEVMCKPRCPYSLTLKPWELLAGLVPVPWPAATEPQVLISGQSGRREPVPREHTRSWEQPDLQPGHAEEHRWAWYCETRSSPGQLYRN